MNSGNWRIWFPLALLFVALQCAAQDYDDGGDDDDAGYGDSGALMSLDFEARGAVNINLTLPAAPASWDSLRSTLAEAVHCSSANLHHRQTATQAAELFRKNWTATERDRYRTQLEKADQRSLEGHCPSALTYQGGVSEGAIDLTLFQAELRRIDIRQLQVRVGLPRTQFLEYSHAYLPREPMRGVTYLFYQIPLSARSTPAVLHFAYGVRRVDVERAFSVLAAFIVLPLVLVLRMRHTALARSKTDPTAAWFGFFRTLNWLLMALMLLWITSGLGARQTLQDWIATLELHVWQSVPATILVMLGPGFLVYFLCTAVSYPVYAELRPDGWSRLEFLQQQLATIGAQLVPMMLFLAALQLIRQKIELAIGMLILAYVMVLVFRHLKLRLMKTFPQALTTGELRDRVFSLATRMGVKLNQVLVLPAGKGQVANAYASAKSTVMFTDYLLQHLTKREVDAVTAHELAHLEHKHPTKRAIAFMAALFLPAYFSSLSGILMAVVSIPLALLRLGTPAAAQLLPHFYPAMVAFEQWQQRDFILVLLGLTGFYCLSRRFENQADRTAVIITSDPEAQITGLLKLSRLNMMPIQVAKASEGWLTHPSTVRRAKRIAEAGGMAPARLREILERYSSEARTSTAALPAGAGQDYYSVPPVSDPDAIRSAARDNVRTQAKLWILRTAHVIPPALLALLVRNSALHDSYVLAAYAAGLGIVAGLLILLGAWLATVGRSTDKRQLLERFSRENVPVGRPGDRFVAFSPSPYPRFYGSHYHWDTGFLVFAQDHLQFVGAKTRFSLPAAQIDIALGQAGPSWWKMRRPYIRWKTGPSEKTSIFSFYLLEPCSAWETRAQALELFNSLQQWQQASRTFPAVRLELAALEAPKMGEITCRSPKMLGGLRANVRVLLGLLPLAVAAGILLRVGLGYMCASMAALRLFESIPVWRYRDTLPQFAGTSPGNNGPAKVRAASANREAL
ncbi:MAG: M48 family metalloprotease [Terriglobales bacterium]